MIPPALSLLCALAATLIVDDPATDLAVLRLASASLPHAAFEITLAHIPTN